ncbi:hypothetical protein, partial [uncultured Prevotella sp.]|uniref:hypothetical protein n=1 Tax=uncultured Prevotella sp. TaxID=159272 RepID=UPI0025886831
KRIVNDSFRKSECKGIEFRTKHQTLIKKSEKKVGFLPQNRRKEEIHIILLHIGIIKREG